MSEQGKVWSNDWIANQQAFWSAFFPTMPSAPGGAQSARDSTPLQAQLDELSQTWQASLARWAAFAKETPQGDLPTADKLREIFAPASWSGPGAGLMDDALRRVLEGPRYATLSDLDRKLLELQQLTIARDKNIAAYQAVLQKAWNQVFERFIAAVNAAPKDGAKHSWRDLTDQWLAIANETLIEVHRSEQFLLAQQKMLRAASDRHLQERKIAEAWCEATHLPTRTEVDELQRQLVELRREVRLLRRAVQPTSRGAALPPPATGASKHRSRPAAKTDRTE